MGEIKLSVPNCATKHKDECKHKIATHDLWNKSHYQGKILGEMQLSV